MYIAVLCDTKKQFEYFYDELLKETKYKEQSMHYSDGIIQTDYDIYVRIITTSEILGRAFDTIIDRRILSRELISRFSQTSDSFFTKLYYLCEFKESE